MTTVQTHSPGAMLLRLLALVLLALLVLAVALLVGSAGLSPARILAALATGGDPTARAVLLELRLPRVLAAFGVGSSLALTGVLLQALFRNPLADPFVLGVSGGAAAGALSAMLLGATLAGSQAGAVGGALVAILLVQLLARGGGTARLLLTGVVIASACGALVSVLLAIADSNQLRGMVFWLAGDLGWAGNPALSLGAAALAAAGSIALARPLNVLASGELRARTVGLDVDRWRPLLFLVCAALTAIAVVSAGTIGFVGLVTPHAVRLLYGTSDHRVVAPASAILGGTLVALADLVARTAVSPRQLPVGAIMALVGAPLFITLLRSASRGTN
jgi:iron complex transport system permease protein